MMIYLFLGSIYYIIIAIIYYITLLIMYYIITWSKLNGACFPIGLAPLIVARLWTGICGFGRYSLTEVGEEQLALSSSLSSPLLLLLCEQISGEMERPLKWITGGGLNKLSLKSWLSWIFGTFFFSCLQIKSFYLI